MALAIVDAGPLYAAADQDDLDHNASLDALGRADLQLVVPALVIAEATYFVARQLGAQAEGRFIRGLRGLDVEGPTPEDLERMGELMEQYADFPLAGTDASVIALAERLQTATVITLDRHHFAAVQPRHCEAFELLP